MLILNAWHAAAWSSEVTRGGWCVQFAVVRYREPGIG